MAGGQVALDVIAQVARARRAPKVVVRIDDGPLRFQYRLLVQGQPVKIRGRPEEGEDVSLLIELGFPNGFQS